MEGQASHVVSNYTETEEQEHGSGEVHYCPAEMILLAPYSAFSETTTVVVVVGAGVPRYNLGRVEVEDPHSVWRAQAGAAAIVLLQCSARTEQLLHTSFLSC